MYYTSYDIYMVHNNDIMLYFMHAMMWKIKYSDFTYIYIYIYITMQCHIIRIYNIKI